MAALTGREQQPFKIDVAKLEEPGLTDSLEIGYSHSKTVRSRLRCQTVAIRKESW
ncbi:MAG TPA: hypothetical protein VJA46_07710 [Acidimicrobiia bacterium]|nr:hypothetical protein [Acidimicrobiia bacterium]